MGKLQEIKDQVAREKGWVGGFNEMAGQFDCPKFVVDEVATRYAAVVAEDALNRAAENATLWVETPINGTEFNTVTKELGDGYDETITVFKDRILSTEINLDL